MLLLVVVMSDGERGSTCVHRGVAASEVECRPPKSLATPRRLNAKLKLPTEPQSRAIKSPVRCCWTGTRVEWCEWHNHTPQQKRIQYQLTHQCSTALPDHNNWYGTATAHPFAVSWLFSPPTFHLPLFGGRTFHSRPSISELKPLDLPGQRLHHRPPFCRDRFTSFSSEPLLFRPEVQARYYLATFGFWRRLLPFHFIHPSLLTLCAINRPLSTRSRKPSELQCCVKTRCAPAPYSPLLSSNQTSCRDPRSSISHICSHRGQRCNTFRTVELL